MKAKDFSAWIAYMAWNDSEVARQLDISRNSVAKYKDEGAPGYIGLACAALAANLLPWEENPPRTIIMDDLVWMVIGQLLATQQPLSLHYIRTALNHFPKDKVDEALTNLVESRAVRANPASEFFTLTDEGMARLASGA